jgi:hypothetical protein
VPFFCQLYHVVTQINLVKYGVLSENKLVIVRTVFVNTLSHGNYNYFLRLVLFKTGNLIAL